MISPLLQSAREHQQAGRLREAEQLYQQVLATDPYHAEALHQLGSLAMQSGSLDVALGWVG
jgi:protein O-GlcNAc transferase